MCVHMRVSVHECVYACTCACVHEFIPFHHCVRDTEWVAHNLTLYLLMTIWVPSSLGLLQITPQ